ILTNFYQHIVTRSILFGIRTAVIGLIASAFITVIRGVFKGLNLNQAAVTVLMAVAIFIAIVKFNIDPVVLILISAAVGLILGLAGFL
ncbi:MAG: chromate transporter, partial [Ignisphaera sp.]